MAAHDDDFDERESTRKLSEKYNVPILHLDEFEPDRDVVRLIPEKVCRRYNLIAVNRAGKTLVVAMSNPADIFAIENVRFVTKLEVEVVLAEESAINAVIDRCFEVLIG